MCIRDSVWPIMAVSMLIEKTSRGKASLNRITELLDGEQIVGAYKTVRDQAVFTTHPVSYTHLDVYKRQAVIWSIRAGSTPASWWSTSATLRPSSGPSWLCPC